MKNCPAAEGLGEHSVADGQTPHTFAWASKVVALLAKCRQHCARLTPCQIRVPSTFWLTLRQSVSERAQRFLEHPTRLLLTRAILAKGMQSKAL